MSKFKTDVFEWQGKEYPIRVVKGHMFAEDTLRDALLDDNGKPVDDLAEYWDEQFAFYFEKGYLSSHSANEIWLEFKNQ